MTALDRFSRGSDFDWHPKIKRVCGDAADPLLITQLTSLSEVVVDCLPDSTPIEAEQFSPREVIACERRKIALAEAVNVSGGVIRYIYMSSGGTVYGSSANPISSENDEVRPVSAYGRLKVALESRLRESFADGRLLIIRPANLYGMPLRKWRSQGLVDAALRAALSGSTLPVYGDGQMVRDYLHVDDAARAIVDLINKPPPYTILNLGSGSGTSVVEVLETIEIASDRKIKLESVQPPPGFLSKSVLDIERLSLAVENFNPRPLSEGVRQHLRILRGQGRQH